MANLFLYPMAMRSQVGEMAVMHSVSHDASGCGDGEDGEDLFWEQVSSLLTNKPFPPPPWSVSFHPSHSSLQSTSVMHTKCHPFIDWHEMPFNRPHVTSSSEWGCIIQLTIYIPQKVIKPIFLLLIFFPWWAFICSYAIYQEVNWEEK